MAQLMARAGAPVGFSGQREDDSGSSSDDAATICAPEDRRRDLELPIPPPTKHSLPHSPHPHSPGHEIPPIAASLSKSSPPPPPLESTAFLPPKSFTPPPSLPPATRLHQSKPELKGSPGERVLTPPLATRTPSPPPADRSFTPPPPRPPPSQVTPPLPPTIPPPPLPASTPPLIAPRAPPPRSSIGSHAGARKVPRLSSGSTSIHPPPPPVGRTLPDDDEAILSPRPIRSARLQGGLGSKLDLTYTGYTSEDSSNEDDSFLFPPTYPARHRKRRASQLKSKARDDMTRSIASTVAQLEEQSRLSNASHSPIVPTNAGRDIQKLWSVLREKRQDLIKIRRNMEEERKVLRDIRRRRDDADNRMQSALRQLLPRLGSSFRGSFADAQALWSEYSTQERVNEAHESSMGQLEAEVLRMEMHFFAALAEKRGVSNRDDESSTSSDDTESVVPDDLPWELAGIAADTYEGDIHPLYDQFQSEIGNLGLAQESWNELQAMKQNIDYKLGFAHLTEKVRLTEEEEDLLAEFPGEKHRRAQDLRESEALARRLRALCQEKGVLGKHLTFNMTYLLHKFFPCDRDNPELGEDLDLLEKPEGTSSTLARPLFPRLLSQSAHLFGDFPLLPEQQLAQVQDLPEIDEHKPTLVQIAQEEVFLNRIFTDCDWTDPHNFVDRWLFHQLRSSSHVALTLFNTSEDTPDPIDLVHWQEHILDTWWDTSLPLSPPQDDSSIGQGDLSQPNSTIYAQEGYSMDNVVLRMLKAV